ncbi:MAG: AAA family ATPase [Myxococcales bacterium]|nr:AAA family ATPase [Myxococcales bacterium]
MPREPLERGERATARGDTAPDEGARAAVDRRLGFVPRALAAGRGTPRLVTVMVVDLAGFVALSEGLDGDETAKIFGELDELLTSTVVARGGALERHSGDGVVALFGPREGDDGASSALTAALLLRARVEALARAWWEATGRALTLHVGIHSGTMLERDAGEARFVRVAVGDLMTTASRLERAARPGQILVSAATRRLASDGFLLHEVPSIRARGRSRDSSAFELLGSSETSKRALDGESSALAGRARELAVLAEVEQRLRAGAGVIVTITGEAGIGKSRLLAEWRARLGSGAEWLEGRCYSQTAAIAYGPLLDLLRQFMALRGDELPVDERARLDAALRRLVGDREELATIFAHLLALPLRSGEEAALRDLEASQRRARVRDAFAGLLEALSARAPTVVVFEDLQWSDSTSLALLDELRALTEGRALALVTSSRTPPRRVEDGRGGPVFELTVAPLSRDESGALVRALLRVDALSEPLLRFIHDRAAGNPFHVKEIVHALHDADALEQRRDGVWIASARTETPAIPDTLHGLVNSRLERLPARTRAMAQEAAVFGGVLLRRVLKHFYRAEESIDPELSEHGVAEFVRLYADDPEIGYVLEHAIAQEAAYDSLSAPRRRELHLKTGLALEELFRDRQAELYDILGDHFFRAGAWTRAYRYLTRAASAAAALGAFTEARVHLRRAHESATNLESFGESFRLRIDVAIEMANLLHSVSPRASLEQLEEAVQDVEALRANNEHVGERRLALLHLHRGVAAYLGMDCKGAREHLTQVLPRAREFGDTALTGLALSVLGRVSFFLGRFDEAATHFRHAGYLLGRAAPSRSWAGNIAGLAFVESIRGDVSAARDRYTELIETVRASGNHEALPVVLVVSSGTALFAGRHAEAVAMASEATSRVHESDSLYVYLGHLFEAWARARSSDYAGAEAAFGRCRRASACFDMRPIGHDWMLAAESEYLLAIGDLDAAARAAEETRASASELGDRFGEGLAARVMAHVHWSRGRRSEARQAYLACEAALRDADAVLELSRTSLQWCARLAGDTINAHELGALRAAVRLFTTAGMERERATAAALLEVVVPSA